MRRALDRARLLALLDADREEHVALLQAFLRAPSPNPPGDTTQAAKVISDYLERKKVPTTTLTPKANMPNIVSDFHGGNGVGPRVVMNGHIDVFPVGDEDDWKHGPWSGYNDGQHIYGRGAVDMKAGTAASVIAFSYLHQYKAALKGSVALTVVSDEETGGRWGSRWLLEQGGSESKWRGDCMINAEPGGIESVRFAEKGTLRLTFTVTTVGAHGAYLHLSEGANRVSVRLATELLSVENLVPDIPDSLREYMKRPDVRQTIDEIMGKGAAEQVLRPTVNIGTWHGGVKVNMIPSKCVLEVDIRLPIGLSAERVLSHIRAILERFPEVELAVQEAASNSASSSPHDHPLLRAIAANAEAVTGRLPLAVPSLGATDFSMAATDERVIIAEFLVVVKTHTLAVWEFLGGTL